MKKSFYLLLLCAVLFNSCSKNNFPSTKKILENKAIITLPSGWKIANSYTINFPSGIQFFLFDSIFNGKKVKAFCLAYDSKKTRFHFKPTISTVAKTPSTFLKDEEGITYAVINGGFFSKNQSVSLVKYNNVVFSPNAKIVNRPYNGKDTTYYPTRSAFGVTATGAPSIAWIYNVGVGNDAIYKYDSPSKNELNKLPQPVPNGNFPTGATLWNTVSAIGGSPILIKNNAIQITDTAELIPINNNKSRPRSAIGYLSNGMVLLFAVEGDNGPNYPGINLTDLANLIKEFNCIDAMNLDGGGSTFMKVNGLPTVIPGDKGVERPVVSVIFIKKK